MNEIKCPHCGEVFQVDEAGYAAIVKQVRDEQFNQEIAAREQSFADAKKNAVDLAVTQEKATKDKEIAELRAQIAGMAQKMQAQKKAELAEAAARSQKELADANARNQRELTAREKQIDELKAQAQNADIAKQLAINTAVQEKENEITRLTFQMESDKRAAEEQKRELIQKHAKELEYRDREIQQLRDFKIRLSTKMVGESLEQHCQNEFNKIWMTAFPHAQFGKDNDASSGSKGDFIFREATDDGIEFISIMFEMKNEMETTATKHKNADFFKELDKDRREKKCEYAVLVSNLEQDNDFYNAGIVDVSYAYPKMYVIRPQCFIAMISLLRNAALSSAEYRRELEITKAQNIDVTNFEAKMMKFKNDFSYNYEQAGKRFSEAITAINNSIRDLEKVRDALTKSDDQLRHANDKLNDLTIKKLVHGNPTMRAKFIDAGADISK